MAENKIQFTDTDDLTPESEKLLQEEAEKAYLRSQNDEHFIEEISEILENEEKENFFPEALKTRSWVIPTFLRFPYFTFRLYRFTLLSLAKVTASAVALFASFLARFSSSSFIPTK